jgi:Flp pilus assembly protein TadD
MTDQLGQMKKQSKVAQPAQTTTAVSSAAQDARYAWIGAGILGFLFLAVFLVWPRHHEGKDTEVNKSGIVVKSPTPAVKTASSEPALQPVPTTTTSEAAPSVTASGRAGAENPAEAAEEHEQTAASKEVQASDTAQPGGAGGVGRSLYHPAKNETKESSGSPSVQGQATVIKPDIQAALNAFNSGRYNEAIPLLQAVVDANPSNAAALIALGASYLNTANCRLAEQPLTDATHLLSRSAVVWYNLAQAQAECGKIREALGTLGQAIKLDRSFAKRAAANEKFSGLRNTPDFAKLTGN